MTAPDAPYSLRNLNKLQWLIAASPFAVIVPVLLGAALDAFVLLWDKRAPAGLSGLIFFADLGIGIWQGTLLSRRVAALATKPLNAGQSFLFTSLRGLFIGALTGLVNGLIMVAGEGWGFVPWSALIGAGLGVIIGLLAGIPFSLIMAALEKGPAPGDYATKA